MKVRSLALGGAVAAVLMSAGAAQAHHSYAMFDRLKKISIEGTVASFDWRNPHIYIWLYVKNPKGAYDRFAVEGGSVTMLKRAGWNANTVKVGEKVTMDINPLKDGRTGGYFVTMTKADGTLVRGDAAAGKGDGKLPGGAGAAAEALARENAAKAKP